MSALEWDKIGERKYETGVEKGVLYKQHTDGTYPLGVAWNGLTGVSEKPTGAEPTPLYADNGKYVNLISAEEFEAGIEAYTYPQEFEECDGSKQLVTGMNIGQQVRKPFGLCYKTQIGNDTEGSDHGYKLHIVYGGTASPAEKTYETINDSPSAITFSWDLVSTPVPVTGAKPSATVVIDSITVDATNLAALELILYGDEMVDPRLPLPDEIKTILEAV